MLKYKSLSDRGFALISLSLILIIPLAIFLGLTFFTQFKKIGFFDSLYTEPLLKAVSPFEIGFNITGITNFGYGDSLPYSSSSDIDTHLQAVKDSGGTIIRIFAANDLISNAEASRRLGVFLDKAATYNISVIVAFINFYDSGEFNPQGTQKYYTDIWNGIPLLGSEFFLGGYKNEYMDFVRTVVSENKNRTNIYAWQVGNELKYDKDPAVFISFMQDVTSTIRNLDPVHPISTGMINAAHTGLTPSQLYPNLPNIDVITVHGYNGDRSGEVDVDWALANGKKAIFSEIGFSGTGDRSPQMDTEIQFWKNKNIAAILQWGLIAKGLPDNGNGDKVFGMDTIWHTDYDKLVSVFKKYLPGDGLLGKYYNNKNFTSLKVTRVDPTIDFDWSLGSPASSIDKDTFSVRWTGFILPPSSGTYVFYANTDEGARLWVNDQRIIDKWFDHTIAEYSGSISLNGGQRYKIKMDYYENKASAAAQLRWSGPSIPKQIIPTSQLFSQ